MLYPPVEATTGTSPLGKPAGTTTLNWYTPVAIRPEKTTVAGDIVEQDRRREQQRRRRSKQLATDRRWSRHAKAGPEEHDRLPGSWRRVVSNRVVGPTTVLLAWQRRRIVRRQEERRAQRVAR